MNDETEIRDTVEIPSTSAPASSPLNGLDDRTPFPNSSPIRHSRAANQSKLYSDTSQDFRPPEVAELCDDNDVFSSNHAQIDSMDYLKSKGCFQLPKRPHLDELVRHYFYNVHPHLPVLEEEEFGFLFTNTERENDLQSRYSILVLQAMLFAASAVCIPVVQWLRNLSNWYNQFISLSALKAMGFQSYHVARKTFYERAKVYITTATWCSELC